MNDLELKKVQQKELEILSYLHDFCKKHNLKYSLMYGTLLGAVRHNGFIPWDDDIDVWMPRKDYEKLISLSNEFDNRFFLQSHETEKEYLYPFAKIRMNNTVFREKFLEKRKIHHGLYIDIFPVDNIRPKIYKYDKFIIKFFNTVLHSKFIENKYREGKNKIIYAFIKLPTLLFNTEFCFKRLKKRFIKINKIKKYQKIKNYFTGCKKVMVDKNAFDNLTLLDFENKKFYAFKNYDEVLNMIYGDYMDLPPIEKRVCRHEISELNLGDEKNDN